MKKILLFLIYSSLLFSQQNNIYQIEIKNESRADSYTYEFDVYIATPKEINLTAYQAVFTFNQKIINGGNLIFSYINNSSQLLNIPIKTIILNDNTKLLLAFASGPGFEQIKGEKRIGKFRLRNTKEFIKNQKLNLLWNLSGNINTIFTGTNNTDITNNFIFKPKK